MLARLQPKEEVLLLGWGVPMPIPVRSRRYDDAFWQELPGQGRRQKRRPARSSKNWGFNAMIPLHLQISGFLSYRDPVYAGFHQLRPGLYLRLERGGQIVAAGCDHLGAVRPGPQPDDSLINTGAKAAEVVFDFVYEDNIYRIQRSKAKDKTGLLEFSIRQPDDPGRAAGSQRPAGEGGRWKPLTEKSLRETEERIQRILRMDYETFINASFFLQGKADQFAQQRPGDRKRILSKHPGPGSLGGSTASGPRPSARRPRPRWRRSMAG